MNKFKIDYITKEEATFILGILKHVPCTNCVDFYKGCSGNSSVHDVMMMDDSEYLYKHIPGTEKHLCGKLRTVINLEDIQEKQLQEMFEEDVNKKISFISRDNKTFLVMSDKDFVDKMRQDMESFVNKKLKNELGNINENNMQTFQAMKHEIESAYEKIKEQQRQINYLKRQKHAGSSQ